MAKLIEKLTEAVPGWGAKLAYGEKTTVDGQDLVPVALVGFGFGGGEGSNTVPDPDPDRDPAGAEHAPDGPGVGVGYGSGGGGGGYAVPIGAYVGGPDGLRFRPNVIVVLVVVVPVVTAAGMALAQIIRALRGGTPG
jgi:hypothetical protein